MRYIKWFFTVLLLSIVLTNGVVDVLAVNSSFSTEALPDADKATFLSNVNISILKDEPKRKPIECFDVNEDGLIALGHGDANSKTVCIYTTTGDFQYGYIFKCDGSFGVELDENNLNIYFVRSDVSITINPIGEVENIVKIQNTSENNSYWNNSVFLTRRKIGDTEYTIENDMGFLNVFASSYSRLMSTSANGEKNVIYDVNSNQLTNMISTVVCVLAFICIVAFSVIRQFFRSKNRSTEDIGNSRTGDGTVS